MKRLFCLLISVCLLAGLSLGCGSGDDQNTLNVWIGGALKADYETALQLNPEDPTALFTKAFLESFHEQHPESKVVLYNAGWAESLNQRVLEAARGNTLPDIIMAEMYVPIYAKAGILKPIELGEEQPDVLPGTIAPYLVDGKIYGLPYMTGCMALQYNKQVLRDAKIPEEEWIPKDWDALLKNCQKVAEANRGTNGKVDVGGIIISNAGNLESAFRALPFVRQCGGDFVDGSGNPTFGSAAANRAYEFIRQLAQTVPNNSLLASEDSLHQLFRRGKAAYQIDGPWTLEEVKGNDFATCRLPLPEDGVDSNLFIANIVTCLTKSVRNEPLALDFIKHLLSFEQQADIFDCSDRFPTSRTVIESCRAEVVAERPYMDTYFEILLHDDFTGGVPSFPKN